MQLAGQASAAAAGLEGRAATHTSASIAAPELAIRSPNAARSSFFVPSADWASSTFASVSKFSATAASASGELVAIMPRASRSARDSKAAVGAAASSSTRVGAAAVASREKKTCAARQQRCIGAVDSSSSSSRRSAAVPHCADRSRAQLDLSQVPTPIRMLVHGPCSWPPDPQSGIVAVSLLAHIAKNRLEAVISRSFDSTAHMCKGIIHENYKLFVDPFV